MSSCGKIYGYDLVVCLWVAPVGRLMLAFMLPAGQRQCPPIIPVCSAGWLTPLIV